MSGRRQYPVLDVFSGIPDSSKQYILTSDGVLEPQIPLIIENNGLITAPMPQTILLSSFAVISEKQNSILELVDNQTPDRGVRRHFPMYPFGGDIKAFSTETREFTLDRIHLREKRIEEKMAFAIIPQDMQPSWWQIVCVMPAFVKNGIIQHLDAMKITVSRVTEGRPIISCKEIE